MEYYLKPFKSDLKSLIYGPKFLKPDFKSLKFLTADLNSLKSVLLKILKIPEMSVIRLNEILEISKIRPEIM